MLSLSLLSDAAFEVIAAIFCFAAAGSSAFPKMENQALVFNALGIVFLIAGVLAVYAALRPQVTLIWAIIVINLAGGLAALGVALFAGLEPVSNAMIIAIIGVALLVVAGLQVVALRRNPPRTLTI